MYLRASAKNSFVSPHKHHPLIPIPNIRCPYIFLLVPLWRALPDIFRLWNNDKTHNDDI